MKEWFKQTYNIVPEFYSDNILRLSFIKEVIGSHKDYTTKGKFIFLLLWLFWGVALITTSIFILYGSILMFIGITLVGLLKLIYLPFKPLTSRIPWSKLKFKIKK